MGHPESCAVSAFRECQILAGKGPEQSGLTLKMALHGSVDELDTADKCCPGGWKDSFHLNYSMITLSWGFIVPLENRTI